MNQSESATNPTKTDAAGELLLPIWSVVSFDKCEASGLSYDEAAKLLTKLDAEKIAGLTLVTDEAAARLRTKHS